MRRRRRLGLLVLYFYGVVCGGQVMPHAELAHVEQVFDLRAPGEIYVWRDQPAMTLRTPMGESNAHGAYLACESEDDPARGRCAHARPVAADSDASPAAGGSRTEHNVHASMPSEITLTFREQRHGQAHDATLFLQKREVRRDAKRDEHDMAEARDTLIDALMTVGMQASTLGRFPFGGIWRAELRLMLVDSTSQRRFPWDATIALHIKEDPEIHLTQHEIDLNWRRQGTMLAGATSFEPCLLDGYGLHYVRYALTLRDPASSDGHYRVRHVDGDGRDAEIIYRPVVSRPGSGEFATLVVRSGEPRIFDEMGRGQVRAVTLGSHGRTVYCVPWTIVLHTPPFLQSSKRAGYYEGELQIEFTPSLQ